MDDLRDCLNCGEDDIHVMEEQYADPKQESCFWFECFTCFKKGSRWSTVKGARVCWNAENKPRSNPYVDEILNRSRASL